MIFSACMLKDPISVFNPAMDLAETDESDIDEVSNTIVIAPIIMPANIFFIFNFLNK